MKKDDNETIDMKTYKIYHVMPCPECGCRKFHLEVFWRMYHIECCDCDFHAEGSQLLNRPIKDTDIKNHAKFSRFLFQSWNDTVAKKLGIEPAKITTRRTPEEVK